MRKLELETIHEHATYTYLLASHVLLALGSLLGALLARDPKFLVLGAPSFVILLLTVIDRTEAEVNVSVVVDQPRALEGDTVAVTVQLESPGPVAMVDVELHPAKDLPHKGTLRAIVSLDPGQQRSVEFNVVAEDWGVVQLGHLTVQARDRFGLTSKFWRHRIMSTLRVHIHEEPARSLMEPNRFRRLVGSHLSQERGDGCEIADIRPYQPGDRLQALNWRISARNDEPWITLRHPDRSTAIVLVLDAFQVYGQQHADAFRRSIRATLGLARLHLGAQDPVGLMIVGQGIRWFNPSLGPRHLHAMTDALLDLSTSNWAERGRTRNLVDRLIPADAVVLAISPLTDRRFSALLTQLLARGQSVQLIEPVTDWESYRTSAQIRSFGANDQTRRIFRLQQEIRRRALSEAGATVIPWTEDQPFESALLGLRLRQRTRRVDLMR